LRIALLVFLAAAVSTPAEAQVYGSVDDVISSPIQGFTPAANGSFVHFDAEWTADGRLAMAMVERTSASLPRTDKLVIALHDPATGVTRSLSTFTATGWSIEHVSVCIPPKIYAIPGSFGFHDHERNRVHVVIGAEAPVYNTLSNGVYQMRVRAVRMLSASFTSPQPLFTYKLSNPMNIGSVAVPYAAEPPRPELASFELGTDYVVEHVFVDPRNTSTGGGHVMISRSYDFGATMQSAFFVTGPYSASASIPGNPLGSSTYARPAICHDAGAGKSLLALGDASNRVVRVGMAATNTNAFSTLTSTTAPASGNHHSPRIASRSNLVNVTYRVGVPGQLTPQPVDWINTNFQGIALQMRRLTELSVSHADIKPDGNTALIAIVQRQSPGSASEHVYRYSERRNDPNGASVAMRVDDDMPYWNFKGVAPVSLLTPQGASIKRVGVVFLSAFSPIALGGPVILER
jgi:hypothetical protein